MKSNVFSPEAISALRGPASNLENNLRKQADEIAQAVATIDRLLMAFGSGGPDVQQALTAAGQRLTALMEVRQ